MNGVGTESIGYLHCPHIVVHGVSEEEYSCKTSDFRPVLLCCSDPAYYAASNVLFNPVKVAGNAGREDVQLYSGL